MAQAAFHARRMLPAVIKFAFVPGEPFKDAQHARVPLRRENGERNKKLLAPIARTRKQP